MVVAAAVICGVSAGVAAPPLPTVSEIVERANSFLSAPVRYRARVGRFEGTVSKKVLQNGVLASRTDATPPSQTIVLSIGNDHFDILPQSRVAIGKSALVTGAVPPKILTSNELSVSLRPEQPADVSVTRQELSTVVRGHKELYQIKTYFSSALLSRAAGFPDVLKRGLIASESLLVEKESWLPVERSLHSPLGNVVSLLEYLEIEPNVDLDDALFSVPAEFATKSPATPDEYYALHKEYWKDLSPVPAWQPMFPKFKEAVVGATPVPPNKLGVPLPQGMTKENFRAAILKKRDDLLESKQVPVASSNVWKIVLLGHGIVLLSGALFLLVRRYRMTNRSNVS